jgi:hypothetical protein
MSDEPSAASAPAEPAEPRRTCTGFALDLDLVPDDDDQ